MRVLVFGVEKLLAIARMPKLLRDAGFTVGVLSVEGTFLGATSHADDHFKLSIVDGPCALAALNKAVDEWGAELIVPGDGSVLSMLHQMVRKDENGGRTGLSATALAVVRRSLPAPPFFSATLGKHDFKKLCCETHVRTPEWRAVATMADLLAFAEEFGYPIVVKADETTAGIGVHICRNEDDLAKAGYATLAQFLNRGTRQPIGPVTVERFIVGGVRQYAYAAWEGDLVAGTESIRIRSNPAETGPSTVIEFVEPGEGEEFVGLLCTHTSYSGFGSYDYIVEEGTGHPYLIDSNPRPVAACAACPHAGVDLAAALYATLTGAPKPRFFLREWTVVALYPQEILRDPNSEFLQTAVHDVPQDDPSLLAAYEARIAEMKARS